tara:strand:- start:199 stop:414 length:216 start_codon:yes stop_codon:yes gene_type:complete
MKSELDNKSLDTEALNQRIRDVAKTKSYRKANIDSLLKNVREEEKKDKRINAIASFIVISVFSVVATIFSL